jgi:hypothetical protein
MRDSEGAELVLAAGKLRLTAPNGIEGFSGHDIVWLGGRDVIIKGRKSVDITSTEEDVRLKAEHNLQLVSEGAVLVESRAPGDGLAYAGAEGSDMRGSGIQLVARDSRIFAHGDMVHLAGKQAVAIESQESKGSVILSAKNILGLGDAVILATPDDATLALTGGSGILSGRSVVLFARDGLALLRGRKAWIPFMELDLPADYYAAYTEAIRPIVDAYHTSADWMGDEYKMAARKEIKFKFRTSKQYGTTGAFKWVEPYWAYLRNKLGKPVDAWAERRMDQRAPWPGKEALDSDTTQHKLKTENNIQPSDRLPLKRAARKPKGGEIDKTSLGQITVVPPAPNT